MNKIDTNSIEVLDRSLPPINYPDVRTVSKENAHDTIRSNKKYSDRDGFLHIPKTGGTTVMNFFKRSAPLLEKIPTPLFHSWTLDLIQEYFPNMRLHFSIRDPLERLISGYNSRLRMGMPEYCVPWRPREAAAFAIFPTAEKFIKSLLSESDYDKSASQFMLASLMTMRWNYSHYFGSAEGVRRAETTLGNIYLVDQNFDLIVKLIEDYVIKINPNFTQDEVLENYTKKHISQSTPKSLLQRFTSDEILKMRSRLSSEYEIYNELLRFTPQVSICDVSSGII